MKEAIVLYPVSHHGYYHMSIHTTKKSRDWSISPFATSAIFIYDLVTLNQN